MDSGEWCETGASFPNLVRTPNDPGQPLVIEKPGLPPHKINASLRACVSFYTTCAQQFIVRTRSRYLAANAAGRYWMSDLVLTTMTIRLSNGGYQ